MNNCITKYLFNVLSLLHFIFQLFLLTHLQAVADFQAVPAHLLTFASAADADVSMFAFCILHFILCNNVKVMFPVRSSAPLR